MLLPLSAPRLLLICLALLMLRLHGSAAPQESLPQGEASLPPPLVLLQRLVARWLAHVHCPLQW